MTEISTASLLDALTLPAVLLSNDQNIGAMNEAAVSLLGGNLVGRHYITAFRQPALFDAVETCFKTGTRQQVHNVPMGSAPHSAWHATAAPLQGATGARQVLLTFTDMTAIEQAEQMRRDFVSNVSHELRTPLTSVMGFVETLQGAAKSDPAAQGRFLSIIADETARMARLVDDLLSLSRVEDQERRRPTDQVDIQTLIQSVIMALAPLAQPNAVRITFQLLNTPVMVPGDDAQLRQVMTNLIENAIKYGGPQKTVHVTLAPPQHDAALGQSAVRIAVRDEGEGIADHHIPRLTERFYRLDSHRSRNIGGTGLGLAIVKHIVNRHRGRLRINSALGTGTTFTVVLPAD